MTASITILMITFRVEKVNDYSNKQLQYTGTDFHFV